jgi:Tol biopolymer transport system component
MKPGSIYASNPALSNAGIVFESMGTGGYVLNRTMAFDGYAFHPATPAAGRPIYFELVSHGHSQIVSDGKIIAEGTNPAVSLDGSHLAYISNGRLIDHGNGALATPTPVDSAAWFPDGKHLAFSAGGIIYDSAGMRAIVHGDEPAVSPDGQSIAFTVTDGGIRHVWTQNLATRTTREISGGACNSYAPAWAPDSRDLIFASDCDRGLGLPRLFRGALSQANGVK